MVISTHTHLAGRHSFRWFSSSFDENQQKLVLLFYDLNAVLVRICACQGVAHMRMSRGWEKKLNRLPSKRHFAFFNFFFCAKKSGVLRGGVKNRKNMNKLRNAKRILGDSTGSMVFTPTLLKENVNGSIEKFSSSPSVSETDGTIELTYKSDDVQVSFARIIENKAHVRILSQ